MTRSMAGPVAGYEPVTPVVEGEAVTQRLSVIYFDTRDRRLAGAYLTLRRRTGGQEAGWHLLVPGAGSARQEVRLPLGRATVTVPAALQDGVGPRPWGAAGAGGHDRHRTHGAPPGRRRARATG
jgi:hypothetical protein